MILSFLYIDLSLLETESSWEVFIKDCDFATYVISSEFSHGLSIIKLNYEVEIRLPFFVVNNWDLNYKFLI